MADTWETLKAGIVSVVEARAKDFLDMNVGLRALLVERAERLAKLTENYLTTADPAARQRLLETMETVRQTMTNEIDAAAANASAAAKGTFKQIVGVAFDMLIKTLPAIVGAL